jgi:hypothetical protein
MASNRGEPRHTMHWEIFDLHRPQAEPLIIAGIQEHFELLSEPNFNAPEEFWLGGHSVSWGPGERLAIPYKRFSGLGNFGDRQVAFVEGRTGAATSVDLPDDLAVLPYWAADGSAVVVESGNLDVDSRQLLRPDGTLTDATARVAAGEPTCRTPDASGFDVSSGCLAPDASSIVEVGVVGDGSSSASAPLARLTVPRSGRSFEISGSFAGWLQVAGSTEPPAPRTATAVPTATASAAVRIPSSGDIPSGTYHVPAGPSNELGYTLEMPSGWLAENGGRTLSKHPDDPREVGINSYVISGIFAESCGPDDSVRPIGPTADDLANALVNQPGGESAGPFDITLGGYAGKRVDLTVPDDLDISTCRIPIGLRVWEDDGGKNLVVLTDGSVSVYIVEVDGRRLVLSTQHRAGSEPADVAEMNAIIESIDIEP